MSNFNSKKKALAPWMKVAATGGILLGAAAIVGSGAFAVWTSSATANASVNAGSVLLNMTDTNLSLKGMAPGDTVQQILTISFDQSTATGNAVTAIKFSAIPGTETKGTNLSPVGTNGYNDKSGSSLYSGSVASDVSDIKYPDGTKNLGAAAGDNALTYTLQTCTVPWAKAPSSTIYSCSGTTTSTAGGTTSTLKSLANGDDTVLTPNRFDGTLAADDQTPFVASGDKVSLYSMISITLPWKANNSFEGASLPLTFNVSAVQRSAVTTAPTPAL